MTEIRYDDIEGLRARISEAWSDWSEPVLVSQAMIDQFAALTGDHTWIHVDVERATRESPYRAPIAHGNLSLSLFAGLPGGGAFEIVGYGSPTNYGFELVRFLGAVPAGSKLQARARLAGVQSRPRGTLVTRAVEVRVAGSERLALVCRPMVLYQPPAP